MTQIEKAKELIGTFATGDAGQDDRKQYPCL